MSRTLSNAGFTHLSRSSSSLSQTSLCVSSLHCLSILIKRLTLFVTAATLTVKPAKSHTLQTATLSPTPSQRSNIQQTQMNFRRAHTSSSALHVNSSSSSSSSSRSSYVYEDENEPGSGSFSTSDLNERVNPARQFSVPLHKKGEKAFEEVEGQPNVGLNRGRSVSREQLARIESYADGTLNNDHFPFYPPILESAASSYRNVQFGANGPSTSIASTVFSSSTCSSSSSVASGASGSGYVEELPSLPPALNPAFSRQGSAEFFGRGLDDDTEEAQFDDEQKLAANDDEEESATRSLYFARQPSMERTASTASTVYNGFDDDTTRGLQFSPPDEEDAPQESEMKQAKSISAFDPPAYQPSMLAFGDRASSLTTVTSAISRASSIASTLSPQSTLSHSNSTAASVSSLSSAPATHSALSPPFQAGIQVQRTVSPQSLNLPNGTPSGSRSPAMSNPLPNRPPTLLSQPSGQSTQAAASMRHSLSSSSLDSSLQEMSLADADSEELPPPSHLVLALRRQNAMISEEHSPLPEGRPIFPMRGASYSTWSSSTSSNQRSVSNSARSSAAPAAMDSTWTSSYSASSSPSGLAGPTLSAPPTPPAGSGRASASAASASTASASSMSSSADASSSSSTRTNS